MKIDKWCLCAGSVGGLLNFVFGGDASMLAASYLLAVMALAFENEPPEDIKTLGAQDGPEKGEG